MGVLPFRQVHLDFHTSEHISGIGEQFDKKQFQDALKKGHINSITVFAKCHHGWAYHPSKKNDMHPNLDFDLLGAQIEAAHEIGVKTPVYLSAGLDEKMARKHPEWLIRFRDERISWTGDFMTPGYHEFCFNSRYLDYLLDQVEEVLENYDTDGLFLDIVGVRKCYCQNCIASMREMGISPHDEDACMELWENTYSNYTKKVSDVVKRVAPGLRVFHNGSHIRRGRRDLAHMHTHLELESLPTGGWGYQHFPLSARYVQSLGMEYLGMTGKFHNSWGEFGGFKHPNALRYETALSIANGAKCSIGDQLHPLGIMDDATYELIGAAYSEVEEKEQWCDDVDNIADIALLSTEAVVPESADNNISSDSDAGCVKMMLEGKYLFDVIDLEDDINKYKVVILPDFIRVDDKLGATLREFISGGGKVLATGISGLKSESDEFGFDFGVRYVGESDYCPAYFKPSFKPKALNVSSYVMYTKGQHVELATGTSLGDFENPYFNREIFRFCSHQHTPSTMESFSCGMSEGNDGIYIAWGVFDEYDKTGNLLLKEMVFYALDRLLGGKKSLVTNLPAQGIVTLMHQPEKDRYVQHMLYASPVRRGAHRGRPLDVIEDILPVIDTEVTLKLDKKIKRIYLAPQMDELEYSENDGIVSFKVDKFECHQMVVLNY